jgi:predicted transcriptional regulator
MNVSSISATSSTASSGSGTSDAIAKLQKQIQAVTTELKNLAARDMDAKAKETQSQLLQNEIQMLQAQIAALQQQRQQADALKIQNNSKPDAADAAQTPTAAKKRTPGLGELLDTYA